MDQIKRLRVAVLGDRADVPNHRLEGVQIGRRHQQQPSLGVFPGDGIEHGLVDVLADQSPKGRIVGHSVIGQGGEDAAGFENVSRFDGRIDLFQLRIVVRPEVSERRDQSAGADPGDGLELRTVTGFRPADQ